MFVAATRTFDRTDEAAAPTDAVAQATVDGETALAALAMAAGTLLGLYALWYGTNRLRLGYRLWATDAVPADRARTADGAVSVTGTAHPLSGTVTSAYTETECLAHEWTKRREETRSASDDDAPTMKTVDRGTESVPFLLRDESGSIPVDPSGAELSLSHDVSKKSHDIRRIESRLDVGDAVHVYGQRRRVDEERDDLGDETIYVGDGDDVSHFRVSDSSPTGASLRLLGKGIVIWLLGVVAAGAFGVGLVHALEFA